MPVIFYQSNFCPECGNRHEEEQENRRWWQHRYFCQHCAQRLGKKWDWLPLAFAGVGLALGIGATAWRRPVIINQTAPPPAVATTSMLGLPPVSAQDATAQLKPAQFTQPATNFLCGARTKRGTACKHRVAAAGMRCFQHEGMRSVRK